MKVFTKVQKKMPVLLPQNVLDPLHTYFFIPKILLIDQKMLNLRSMKND
jgi:hypothetical protein